MSVVGADLGLCGVFLNDGSKCQGRLLVDREQDGFLEAECSSCGGFAARAVTGAKAAPEAEPDGAEAWWNDR